MLYGSRAPLEVQRERLSAPCSRQGRAIAAPTVAAEPLSPPGCGGRVSLPRVPAPVQRVLALEKLTALARRRGGWDLHIPKGRGQLLPDYLSQRLRRPTLWSRRRGVRGRGMIVTGRHAANTEVNARGERNSKTRN